MMLLMASSVMAATYPARGSTNWDTSLFQWLNVSMNEDGTLKSGSLNYTSLTNKPVDIDENTLDDWKLSNDSSAFDTRLALKSTADVTEGANLYYTQARFDTAFGGKSTSDLSEGTNKYFTDARAIAAVEGTGNTYLDSEVDTALALKANLASPTFTGTVAGITKTMVGLGNVDNTADTAKPVSTAQQTALDLKSNIASPTFTGTVSGITATMVGLGNVDNTADANKPVSTSTQTALNLKANLASPTFTGTVAGITATMVGLGSVTNDAQLKAADLDTDGTLAANSDTKIPSQKAVKTYVDTGLGTKQNTITDTLSLTPRATAPTGTTGLIYVDSTANELCYFDGTVYQGISTGTDANCA